MNEYFFGAHTPLDIINNRFDPQNLNLNFWKEKRNLNLIFYNFNFIPSSFYQILWICLLCRKKQELLIKTGEWTTSRMANRFRELENEMNGDMTSGRLSRNEKKPRLDYMFHSSRPFNGQSSEVSFTLERRGSLDLPTRPAREMIRRQYSHDAPGTSGLVNDLHYNWYDQSNVPFQDDSIPMNTGGGERILPMPPPHVGGGGGGGNPGMLGGGDMSGGVGGGSGRMMPQPPETGLSGPVGSKLRTKPLVEPDHQPSEVETTLTTGRRLSMQSSKDLFKPSSSASGSTITGPVTGGEVIQNTGSEGGILENWTSWLFGKSVPSHNSSGPSSSAHQHPHHYHAQPKQLPTVPYTGSSSGGDNMMGNMSIMSNQAPPPPPRTIKDSSIGTSVPSEPGMDNRGYGTRSSSLYTSNGYHHHSSSHPSHHHVPPSSSHLPHLTISKDSSSMAAGGGPPSYLDPTAAIYPTSALDARGFRGTPLTHRVALETIRNDSLSSDHSESFHGSPVHRPMQRGRGKGKKLQHQFSLSSSDEEIPSGMNYVGGEEYPDESYRDNYPKCRRNSKRFEERLEAKIKKFLSVSVINMGNLFMGQRKLFPFSSC